jgi:hypothetical protein
MTQSDGMRVLPQNTAAPAAKNAIQLVPKIVVIAIFGFALIAGLMHYTRILRLQDLTGSNGDYSNYAEIARVMANGGRMYVDYWTTKPPGMFFVLTPFVLLFGNTFLAINLATVLMITAFVLALTALSYQITRSKWAALAAAALALIYSMEKNGPETTLLMSTFGTLAMLCVVVGRGRLAYMVGAGVLFAAGVLTKQTIAIELPILVALAYHYAPERRVRALIGVLAGGAALAIIVTAYTLSQGVFDAMWSRAFSMNAQYVLAEDGRWHFREGFTELFERNFLHFTMRYLTPMLVLAVVALVMIVVRRSHPQNRALFVIVLAWALLAFAGASAGRAFKAYYYFEIVPPFTVLLALALVWADRTVWQWLGVGALVFAVGNFHWRYAGLSEALERSRMREERPVMQYINRHTDEDDCIWTWGQLSYINYLTGRDSCASPALNGFMMDETAFPITQTRIEYMNEIIHATPALHIRTDDWGYFPELEKYAGRYLRNQLFADDTYEIYAVDRASWRESASNFGGEIALIGYDLFSDQMDCPLGTLQLAMTWRAFRQPAHQYQMFAQFVTLDQQTRITGYDGAPAEDRPTDTWLENEVILGQTFEFELPGDMAFGDYKIIVGLYDVETQERVPVIGANGEPLGTYTVLRDIDITDCD